MNICYFYMSMRLPKLAVSGVPISETRMHFRSKARASLPLARIADDLMRRRCMPKLRNIKISLKDFEIRVLSECDVGEYRPLRLRALKEEPTAFGASYEEWLDRPLEEVASRLVCSDEAFFLGAFTPKLVGVVGFFRRQGRKSRHKGTVFGVYVAPEFRNRGVCRALLSATIDRAKVISGLEYLLLSVITSNKQARNLYLSLGFQSYGTEKSILKVGVEYYDEDLMSLQLF